MLLRNPLTYWRRNSEKKILNTVSINNTEATDFLKKVVNINSGTMNPEGVKKVGMVFKAAYEAISFKTNWIDMSQVNRAGHLFAETNGDKGKKFMYKRFRELILGVSSKEFSNQQKELETEFNTWKRDLEQLDDVCVIGVKI